MKKLTAKQREAGARLELYGIVHYLLTEQRCPIIWNGKLAHVSCPGVSKEAFKLAIDKRVIRNLCAYVEQHIPKKPARQKAKAILPRPSNFGKSPTVY